MNKNSLAQVKTKIKNLEAAIRQRETFLLRIIRNARRNVNRLQNAKNALEMKIKRGGRSGFFSMAPRNYNSANNQAKLNKIKNNLVKAKAAHKNRKNMYETRMSRLRRELDNLYVREHALEISAMPTPVFLGMMEAERRHRNNPFAFGAWTRT
jgi:hypothetical protein